MMANFSYKFGWIKQIFASVGESVKLSEPLTRKKRSKIKALWIPIVPQRSSVYFKQDTGITILRRI